LALHLGAQRIIVGGQLRELRVLSIYGAHKERHGAEQPEHGDRGDNIRTKASA
jgi:hypothetical protein